MEPPSLQEMMGTTSNIVRDMEALKNEHKSMLSGYQEAVDCKKLSVCVRYILYTCPSDGNPEDTGWDPELEAAVKKEKEELVNESMKKLEEGMKEAQVKNVHC